MTTQQFRTETIVEPDGTVTTVQVPVTPITTAPEPTATVERQLDPRIQRDIERSQEQERQLVQELEQTQERQRQEQLETIPEPTPATQPEQDFSQVLGEGGENVAATFTVGGETHFFLKNTDVVRFKDGRLEKVNTQDFIRQAMAENKEGLEQAQAQLRDIQAGRAIAAKTNVVEDYLKEALTFGKAETDTLNRQSIEQKYDQFRKEAGDYYDQQVAEMKANGVEPAETKEQFLNRTVISKNEYVNAVLEAQPELKALAAEAGKASIPLYGTIHTWENSPNWARAVSVASDVAFLLPVVGQLAAAGRAGGVGSALATGGRVAVVEALGPLTVMRNPLSVVRGIKQPLTTITDTLSPRGIPLSAVEARFTVPRIQVTPGAPRISNVIDVPEDVLRQVDPVTEGFRVRDDLTLRAIRGQVAESPLGSGYVRIEQAPLQRVVGEAAVHSSPDIRNILAGLEVKAPRPTATGELGLFVAPSFTRRFAFGTSTGGTAALSERAAQLVELGRISKNPVPGAVIIRDPKILAQLKSSNKLFQGTAEIEQTLPPGTKIPPPSQLLFTRDPITGKKFTLAIVGDPMTPAQIAKLKIFGAADAFKDIFSTPGSFSRRISNDWEQAARLGEEAESLIQELRRAERVGDSARVSTLNARIGSLLDQGERIASRASNINDLEVRPAALYTGNQEVGRAVSELGETRRGSLGEPALTTTRTRVPVEEPERTTTRAREPVDTRRTGEPARGEPRTTPEPDEPRVRIPRTPPAEITRVPARIRPVDRSRISISPEGEVKRGSQTLVEGVVAWRQGFGWWVVAPPYRGRADAVFSLVPPAGVHIVRGPKSAIKTITTIGGDVNKRFVLDLGAFEARVRPASRIGADVALRFHRTAV